MSSNEMQESNIVTTKADISERKMAANRKNSQKSTGPQTVDGKNSSKWNALKHGLRAKEVVIPALGGDETQENFNSLLSQLMEELDPQGILEGELVEEIAWCFWRQKRALRCEVGHVRKEIESAQIEKAIQQEELLISFNEPGGFSPGLSRKIRRTSSGIKHLIGVLEEAKGEVKHRLYEPKSLIKELASNFGTEPSGVGTCCCILAGLLTKKGQAAGQATNVSESKLTATDEDLIIRVIDAEKRSLEGLLKQVEEREQREREAMLASLSLPESEVMDKILRYETAIDRKMYRAMSELERLQRQRKGQPVLPRINVDISGQN